MRAAESVLQAYPKIVISPTKSQRHASRQFDWCNTLFKTMTTAIFENVSVTTQGNVYFDGKCVSYSITLADGSKKSIGVILPATLTFKTGAPEIMECVGGACDYKLAGSDVWRTSNEGEKFSVPGDTSFEIRVMQPYHYICHFG